MAKAFKEYGEIQRKEQAKRFNEGTINSKFHSIEQYGNYIRVYSELEKPLK